MTENNILTEEILEEVTSLYGLQGERRPSSGGYENIVYEYCASKTNLMIRFTPFTASTSLDSIQAEVDFMRYLHRNGASIPAIIPSMKGNCIEVIDSQSAGIVVVAFEKAVGVPAVTLPVRCWTPSLIQTLGALMGNLHCLATSYTPPEGVRRPEWDRDEFYYPQKFVPHQSLLVEKSQCLLSGISSLPKNSQCYGLIHSDMNFNNLYVDKDRITLIDFDDSRYSFFVHDIAVALFFFLMDFGIQKRKRKSYAEFFLDNFIKGYNQEHAIDTYWLQQIPLFLDLQVMLCYTVIVYDCDLNNLNGWCRRFMKNRKAEIEQGIPFVSLERWLQKRI
jgi:Ser/Thr protein kinase RdoA (MazF antagonist)